MSRKDLFRRFARVTRDLAILLDEAAQPPARKLAKPATGAPVEQAILQALSKQEPLTGKRIAAKTGYAPGRYLRATLADMVRRGVLTHGPDGYSRGTPVPPG